MVAPKDKRLRWDRARASIKEILETTTESNLILKICKNCLYFEVDESPSYLFDGDFKIGDCKAAESVFDVRDMKSNEVAVQCGHDGGISFGENFGCIHFRRSWETSK